MKQKTVASKFNLLIDDEDLILQVGKALLEKLGYSETI